MKSPEVQMRVTGSSSQKKVWSANIAIEVYSKVQAILMPIPCTTESRLDVVEFPRASGSFACAAAGGGNLGGGWPAEHLAEETGAVSGAGDVASGGAGGDAAAGGGAGSAVCDPLDQACELARRRCSR